MQAATKHKNGTDEAVICKNYEIKISEIQIALLDYNIAYKQINLMSICHHYNEIKHFDDLKANIDWIIMQMIGEIAFRNHIKEIQLHQMTLEFEGLLSLIELSKIYCLSIPNQF